MNGRGLVDSQAMPATQRGSSNQSLTYHEEMEKIKLNMVYETNVIHRDFEDSFKIIFYMLSSDLIFTDNLIYKTDEVIKAQKKFRDFFEE